MSRSTQSPVPRLDLAPKLKRPLSLWNPLDYLRLLYWVFYFPQALRWYVDRYGGEAKVGTWRKRWQQLQQNPVQMHLCIQGLMLTVITPLLLCRLLEATGLEVRWWGGVAIVIIVGIVSGVMFGVTGTVAVSVAAGVTLSVVGGVAFGVTSGATRGLVFGVVFGVEMGAVLGVVSGVVGKVVAGSVLI